MIKLFILLLLISGCADVSQLTPTQVGSISAVGTATVAKVKQDVQEIATLKPYLTIKPLEICYKTDDTQSLTCVLTPCKLDCTRTIDVASIDYDTTVFIKEQAWLEFSAEIKALCTSDNKDFSNVCDITYFNYDSVNKVVLFND